MQALSDRSGVVFDDECVVVNAGIVLAVALGRRLGIEALVDAAFRLGGRPGACGRDARWRSDLARSRRPELATTCPIVG